MIEVGANTSRVFRQNNFVRKILIGIDNEHLSTYKVSLPAHF